MSGHEEESVVTQVDGAALILTINRPDKANAVNRRVSCAIAQGLLEAEASPEIRAVIITGAGRRFFSAGADVASLRNGESVLADTPYQDFGFGGCVERTISKPVIAAVNGLALGGGFEIALAADVIVADPSAAFSFPESRLGIFPGAGGVHRLRDRIPWAVAADLLLTGRRLAAERAAALGLVSRLSEPDGVMDTAQAVVAEITQNAPLGVMATKRLFRDLDGRGRSRDEVEVWERSHILRDRIVRSVDASEGFQAFLEKRAPQWTGA